MSYSSKLNNGFEGQCMVLINILKGELSPVRTKLWYLQTDYFHSQTCQTSRRQRASVPAFNLRSKKNGAAGNEDLWWTVMIWPLDLFENCLPNVKQRMFREGNCSPQPVITEFTAGAVNWRLYSRHSHGNLLRTQAHTRKREHFPCISSE